jgi:hypothetical protein
MAIDVFISYSHSDEELYERLARHLKPLEYEGAIRPWRDRQITAGRDFSAEIVAELATAGAILLLVSPDFIASEFCWGVEMKRAMARHESGGARVVPIILRPVDWQRSPFGKLLALPKDGKPVTLWNNQDEALVDVAKSIRRMVDDLNSRRSRDILSQSYTEHSRAASSPVNSGNATITLTRLNAERKGFKNYKRPAYEVFLDDVLTTKIEAGEAIPFSVGPGYHHLQVGLKFRRSEKCFIKAAAGEQISLECGNFGIDDQVSVGKQFQTALFLSPPYYVRRRTS